MVKATRDLEAQGLDGYALTLGDYVPREMVLSFGRKMVSVYDYLDQEPLILNFYRGGWCPYCNLELTYYDDLLKEAGNEGISMLAISPEQADVSAKKRDLEALAFDVVTDLDNRLAKAMGLVFDLPKKLLFYYRLMGINMKKSQKNDRGQLPIPATYVVDRTGKIIYAWMDADYTKRADPQEVIDFIKDYKKTH